MLILLACSHHLWAPVGQDQHAVSALMGAIVLALEAGGGECGLSPAGSCFHLGPAGSSEGLEMLWFHAVFLPKPRRAEYERRVPASEHVSMIHGLGTQ